MNRISARISAAIPVPSITCPGCGRAVVPRGEDCPLCDFPLSRFASRLKWFRTLFVGAVVSGVSVVFFGLAMLADLRRWWGWALALIALVGLGTFLVGLGGVVFGGRHTAGRARTSSDWTPPGH